MKRPDFPSQAAFFFKVGWKEKTIPLPSLSRLFNQLIAVVVVLLLVLASLFFWSVSSQEILKKEEHMEEQTPEQKIFAIANKNPVPATELAMICDEFPELATKLLRSRKMAVSGTVKMILVKGINQRDLTVDLIGSNRRVVTIYSDFSRLTRAAQALNFNGDKYAKTGRETVKGKTLIFRETESVKIEGYFERVDPGSVKLYRTSGF